MMTAVELSNETLGELLSIERTLWGNNPRVYHETYEPNAILIFPGIGRIDRENAVAAIQKENADGRAWADVKLADALGRWLTPDVVALVTYDATARWNDEAVASRAHCATVYVRHGDTWRVAFHQQTAK
jgi:Domain of unknown function (DUF4440)